MDEKQLSIDIVGLAGGSIYLQGLIHLADVIDAIANNIKCRQEKWDKCCEFLVQQKDYYLMMSV